MGIVPLGDYVACFARGDYLYAVSRGTVELKVFDVSVVGSPSQVGSLPLAHVPTCVYIYGTVCYIGCSDGALIVANIDNPAAPTQAGTKLVPGQNWAHIFCVASNVFLSGPDSGGIGIYSAESNPQEVQLWQGHATSQAVVQGRRCIFGAADGSSIRSFNLGGFSCEYVSVGSLDADRVNAEEFLGRHLHLQGAAVVRELTVLGTRGEMGTTYRITLGSKSIFFSDTTPDPNTLVTAKKSSLFLASDGSVWRNTDNATAWTAM